MCHEYVVWSVASNSCHERHKTDSNSRSASHRPSRHAEENIGTCKKDRRNPSQTDGIRHKKPKPPRRRSYQFVPLRQIVGKYLGGTVPTFGWHFQTMDPSFEDAIGEKTSVSLLIRALARFGAVLENFAMILPCCTVMEPTNFPTIDVG